MYKCNICSKKFKFNSDFTRHVNRKKSCINDSSKTTQYKCSICNTLYANKSNLNRHTHGSCTNSKTIVQTDTSEIVNNQTDTSKIVNNQIIIQPSVITPNKSQIACKYCDVTFTRKDTMKNHIDKFCKIKKQIDKHNDEKHTMYDKLAKKIEIMENNMTELKIKNDTLTKKLKNNNKTINKTINNNTNTNSNNTINNTVNIKLIANSKEDLDFITNNEAYKYICRSANAVPELIQKLNFDKDKPENHNIYLPNFGSNTVCIFNGDKWIRSSLYDHLDDMIDNKNNFLSNKHDELKEKYNDHQKNAVRGFDRYLDWYNSDPKYKFGVYKRVKNVLFNGRDIVLDTKKLNVKPLLNHEPNNESDNEPDNTDHESDHESDNADHEPNNADHEPNNADHKSVHNADNDSDHNSDKSNNESSKQDQMTKDKNKIFKELCENELLDEFIEELNNREHDKKSNIKSKDDLIKEFMDGSDDDYLNDISNSDEEFIEDSDEGTVKVIELVSKTTIHRKKPVINNKN